MPKQMNIFSDWIDTCVEKALQALKTFDSVSHIEIDDNADLVPMCPAASERAFVCTLYYLSQKRL